MSKDNPTSKQIDEIYKETNPTADEVDKYTEDEWVNSILPNRLIKLSWQKALKSQDCQTYVKGYKDGKDKCIKDEIKFLELINLHLNNSGVLRTEQVIEQKIKELKEKLT